MMDDGRADACGRKPRRLITTMMVTGLLAMMGGPSFSQPAARAPTAAQVLPNGPGLSLAEVLALVLAKNADLEASRTGTAAVEARQIDAGKLANPEVNAFSENLARPGSARGVEGPQTTLQLSQAVPLTARLGHARAVARGEHTVAQREFEIKRAEILGEVTRAFIGLLVAQRRAALADEQRDLVEQVAAAEEAQVAAGQFAPFERSRAVAALAEARLRVNDARRDVRIARQRLASYWTGDELDSRPVIGTLDTIPSHPPLPALLSRLEASPELARDAAEISLRISALALERARATPDITISGGIRRYEDEGNYAGVVGVSIPLQIFTRNESGIAEADRRRRQAELQLDAARKRLTATISESYEKLETAETEIAALRTTLIPASEQSMAALREGYRLRKFPVSQLLLSEQSLTALRDRLLVTLGSYHQSYADLEQLLGSLDASPAGETR